MNGAKNNMKYTFALFALLFALHPSSAFAAKIYFETPTHTISAGDTVIVNVNIDPEGQSLNTVDGTIDLTLPSTIAKVSDLSVAHSVLTLWPRKPSLSDDGKSISFVGGIPDGFSTPSTLFQIIVTAKNTGTISFDAQNVLAYINDGKATLAPMMSDGLHMNVVPLAPGAHNINAWSDALTADITPPAPFTISAGKDPSLYDGKTFITFNAVDAESGIDHYEVTEGSYAPVRSGTTYVLRDQSSYERVFVSAYDKANNVRTETYRTSFRLSFTFVLIALLLIGLFVGLKKKKLFTFFVIAFVFFAGAQSAHAATLGLTPSATHVTAGDIVNVTVYVNTAGKAINTSNATIQFPSNILQVMSLSKTSSIFSLWVEDPTFSNSAGTISFDGGVPNPGYTGSHGAVLTATFLAKKTGTATLLFSDASVRANDGLGTDILTGTTGTSFTVVSSTANTTPQQPTTPALAVNLSPLVITSSTHPEQTVWYNNNNVELAWDLPDGALSMKTYLGAHADTAPSVLYKPAISSKSIPKLYDGIWYFVANYTTADGVSPTARYRLQIDTKSPDNLSLTATEAQYGGANIDLHADDTLSGVDHYNVTVDNTDSYVFKADQVGGVSTYIPIATAGSHNILAKAFDRAGNSVDATTTVVTKVPSVVTIDTYPLTIEAGKTIDITGSAPYANAPLSLSLVEDSGMSERYNFVSGNDAHYHVVTKPVTSAGTYTLRVDLLRNNGSVIISSRDVTTNVTKPLLLQIGSFTVSLFSILVPLAALLFLFFFLLYYGWYKFFVLRRHMRADMDRIEARVHHSLGLLSDEVTEQLGTVERSGKFRDVSPGEKQAIADLKEAIAEIDVYIKREIKKIEGVETKKVKVVQAKKEK